MPGDSPSGFNNQPSTYVPARIAVALLGVKRDTLYAYASRGLIRAVPDPSSPGGRSRLYHRDDLLRLRARHDARTGHGPVAAGALRWGEAVLESAITAITPEGAAYRGHLATDLTAHRVTFEQVAELLWTGVLPPSAATWPLPPWHLPTACFGLPPGTHPLRTMALVAAVLGATAPPVGTPPHDERGTARILVRALALSLALPDPDRVAAAGAEPTLARTVLTALGAACTPIAIRAVDTALVLCADHELNVSAFAARIAASAGADLHACVGAALATASGTLHAGVCDAIEALVANSDGPVGVAHAIAARVARGGPLPGFGHPLYPRGDPRGAELLATAASCGRLNARTAAVMALVEGARAAQREAPTVDLGLVALAAALDLPPGSASGLFVVGRAAGWIAHVVEQREQGVLLRPRARYVGRAISRTEPSAQPTSASEAIPRK